MHDLTHSRLLQVSGLWQPVFIALSLVVVLLLLFAQQPLPYVLVRLSSQAMEFAVDYTNCKDLVVVCMHCSWRWLAQHMAFARR